MKIVDQNASENSNSKMTDSFGHYYLVSIKWSLLNDQYITFVRKSTIGYCYNLDWAGPMPKFELEPFEKKNNTIIVPRAIIERYLISTSIDNKNCSILPNTEEIRRAIGFDEVRLQLVI